jgi:hypothetical protein
VKLGDHEEIIEVWENDPNVHAFADLLNCVLNKPKEQPQDINVNGQVRVPLFALSAGDVVRMLPLPPGVTREGGVVGVLMALFAAPPQTQNRLSSHRKYTDLDGKRQEDRWTEKGDTQSSDPRGPADAELDRRHGRRRIENPGG